jgi:hypothetical protein
MLIMFNRLYPSPHYVHSSQSVYHIREQRQQQPAACLYLFLLRAMSEQVSKHRRKKRED